MATSPKTKIAQRSLHSIVEFTVLHLYVTCIRVITSERRSRRNVVASFASRPLASTCEPPRTYVLSKYDYSSHEPRRTILLRFNFDARSFSRTYLTRFGLSTSESRSSRSYQIASSRGPVSRNRLRQFRRVRYRCPETRIGPSSLYHLRRCLSAEGTLQPSARRIQNFVLTVIQCG